MSLISRTYNFTNGTTADGSQVDTNENTVYTWANGNVDHFNIGSAGIYMSQCVPTSAAQATLGGTVGLILGGYAQTVIPLTIYGNALQSADLWDVLLTNGGTKVLSIAAGGGLTFGAGITAVNSAVQIYNDNGGTNGLILNVPTSSTNGFQFMVNGVQKAQISAAGSFFSPAGVAIIGNASIIGSLAAGDIVAARSSSTGFMWWGGTGANGSIDYNINVGSQFSFRNGTNSAYAPFSAGTYTNASDASLKTGIAPITGSLAKITALTPITFQWAHDGTTGIGFTAQDIQAQFPDAVIADNAGLLGYAPTAVLAHLVQAFQEYIAAHP